MITHPDRQKCPICAQASLYGGIKRMRYMNRMHILAYEQPDAWCDYCGNGLVAGQ